jgi:hypothetical protein
MKANKIATTVIFCILTISLCLNLAENMVSATKDPAKISSDAVYQPLISTTYGNWTYSNGSSCSSYGLAMGADGGYIIAGNQLNIPITFFDAWLVKVDSTGVEQWNKSYGSIGADFAYCIVNCSDGGYAFTGYSSSYGKNISDANVWLVKIDENGTQQWMKTYGGIGTDYGMNLIETSDGGYMVIGCTDSSGAGSYDFYIIKTDPSGNMQWSKIYGYSGWDIAYAAVETTDEGYVIAGSTNTSQSGFKGWLIKLDSEGNQIWNQTYRGPEAGAFRRVVKTSTGFAMVGTIGKLNEYSCWLVNVDEKGAVIWSRTYGEGSNCGVYDFIRTSDAGYALTGFIIYPGNSDLLLLKIDKDGNMEWNQTLGGTKYDQGYNIIQTPFGYALSGESQSYNSLTTNQYWLILTDNNGRINYNLTTRTMGQGTISPGNQTYMSGTTIDLVAVPADGWAFNCWSGDASGTSNKSIIMNSDKTVTATFTQIPYNLTIVTVGSGSVYPGNQSYTPGTNVSLSAINSEGWLFSGWSGDVSGASNTTITMDTNKIVTATFTQDQPSPSPSGSSASTSPSSTSSSSSSTPTATPVAPEFSSIIMLPILFATLVAVTIKRKIARK